MKRPEQGDRVRFSAQDDVVEGEVERVVHSVLCVRSDDGKFWLVGVGDVLVVEP